MSAECSNVPLAFEAVSAQRQQLVNELTQFVAGSTRDIDEPLQPLPSYSLLFVEQVNVGIQRRVAQAYADALTSEPQRGWVYVFRDRRDGDVRMVKIGSTTGRAQRRIAQWRRELGNATPAELSLLFAVRARDVRLTEAVVHRLLFCQWQPKRINIMTGRRLVEYFRVENLELLRLLIVAVVRHTDWYAVRTHDMRVDRVPVYFEV